MSVHLWTFDDMVGETWTVPINPKAMTKIRSDRPITTQVTTAVDGQTLFFEARRRPAQWEFSGDLFTKVHYDMLNHWVYEKGRIAITDHFLRRLFVVLTDFDAVPHRSVKYYWRHDYKVKGLLYDVDAVAAVLDVVSGPSGA